MKTIKLIIATAVAVGVSCTAQAEIYAFISQPLTPTQEVPAITTSKGYGRITALYDDATKVLMYNVYYVLNAGSTLTNAHFHGPSAVGAASAPVLVPLGLTLPTTNSGKIAGSVTLTATQETHLLAGNVYFNLHSSQVSGGELRGQLVQNPDSFGNVLNNGVLSLDSVLVPGANGAQTYKATLNLNNTNSTFSISSATPIR